MSSVLLVLCPPARTHAQVDTDVILYPDRLLRFLRTLEAAVGTRQDVYFGHAEWNTVGAGCGTAPAARPPPANFSIHAAPGSAAGVEP